MSSSSSASLRRSETGCAPTPQSGGGKPKADLDDLELTSVAMVIAMSTPNEYIAYYKRVNNSRSASGWTCDEHAPDTPNERGYVVLLISQYHHGIYRGRTARGNVRGHKRHAEDPDEHPGTCENVRRPHGE
jgi:hypothetical protein